MIILTLLVLAVAADAYESSSRYPLDYDELIDRIYTPNQVDISLSRIKNYLIDNGWVKDYVEEEELDYILLLTRHLSVYYDNIDPNLITATIAVESRFDRDAKNNGARGLMQLLPAYHEDRLIQFIEEDEKYSRNLFYDARLNIITGMDYLSYILEEVDGDLNYALMWYNQGAVSACDMYEGRGVVSSYAITVQRLAKELSDLCVIR